MDLSPITISTALAVFWPKSFQNFLVYLTINLKIYSTILARNPAISQRKRIRRQPRNIARTSFTVTQHTPPWAGVYKGGHMKDGHQVKKIYCIDVNDTQILFDHDANPRDLVNECKYVKLKGVANVFKLKQHNGASIRGISYIHTSDGSYAQRLIDFFTPISFQGNQHTFETQGSPNDLISYINRMKEEFIVVITDGRIKVLAVHIKQHRILAWRQRGLFRNPEVKFIDVSAIVHKK